MFFEIATDIGGILCLAFIFRIEDVGHEEGGALFCVEGLVCINTRTHSILYEIKAIKISCFIFSYCGGKHVIGILL